MNASKSSKPSMQWDWIQVEVSAVCNASCAYCVLNCYRDKWKGGLMAMDTFERIQPYLGSAGLVFLQGWGEPLLHPQLQDMIKAAKIAGARVGFTTNATLLNKDYIDQLLPLNVDIMGVSLAGTQAATHNRFRHGCDFEKVDSNLVELKRAKEVLGTSAPETHIAYMLLRSNLEDLKDLPELADRWGAKQIVVSNLTFIGSEDLQQESLLEQPALWSVARAALERAKSAAAKKGIDLQFYGPEIGEPFAVCRENVLKSCFINYRGEVTPCVMTGFSLAPGQPAKHYFQGRTCDVESVVFGNVNDRSLAEIRESKQARAFHGQYESRLAPIGLEIEEAPSPCRHCYKLIEQ